MVLREYGMEEKQVEQGKKPHIAMLIGALSRGGSERVLVNLAEYLVNRGWRVTLVTQYRKNGEYPLNPAIERVISDIAPEETGRSRVLNFIRRFRKLRKIWKKQKPDLILSFIGKNNIMALLTSRFLHIPVAVSVRGEPSMEYYNGWMRFMARQLFGIADGVILQTGRCFDFFPQSVRKKAVIMKNPISREFFREPYQGERRKEITAVGRIDENKNHELLIRAFAGISEEFSEYRLVIYGEGELRSRLIDMAAELGLEGRISLPGAAENVADAIYKTSVFVLPSNTEGVPNTLIEAMALGLPVISTDCPCGGPADLIEQGVNGILVPVQNQTELQEKLHFLLNNLHIRESMGEAARKTAAIYQPETVCEEWRKYLSYLAFRRRR